jgi:hypothetical protein
VKFSLRVPIVVLVVAILLSAAAPAFSQVTQSPPSPGGLFGHGDVERPVRHKLDFSLSLVEANDDDAPAELRGIDPTDTLLDTSSTLDGYSTLLMGNADYRWRSPRVQVGAAGASTLRYYSQLEAVRSVSQTAGFGVSARLGGRTTFFANQTAAYSPSYLYRLFPGDAVSNPGDTVPAAPDYAIRHSESYSYGTTLALTRGLTRRSRVGATGEFQHTDFLDQAGTRPGLHSLGIGAEFSRNLTRNTAMRIGYRYRTGKFGSVAEAIAREPGVSATEHGVDVGVQYSRPLSAIRRLIFEVSSGSSIVNTPVSSGDQSGTGRFYGLSGDVAVAWQFSTTWQTRGTFRRGLEYVAGLSEPVYVDGFAAELRGFMTPRIDVLAATRYSSGASALTRGAVTFDTYGGDLRIGYALTRSLAAYGQYLHYFYDFRRNARLAPGIPSSLDRNGVRAGLTLWVPTVRR